MKSNMNQNGLQSLEQKTELSDIESTDTNPSKGSKYWNMYSSWKELSLAKYIEIEESGKIYLLDKNYDRNKDKSSNPIPIEVLAEKWNEINSDFTFSMSKKASYALRLEAEYECYSFQYTILRTSIDLLRHISDKEALNVLKMFNIHIRSEFGSDSWTKDLDRADRVCKSILIKANKAKDDLDKQKSKAKSSSSESSWEEVLIAMGDHKGVLINPNDITLYQFSIRYNNFTKELERLNSKNGNNK